VLGVTTYAGPDEGATHFSITFQLEVWKSATTAEPGYIWHDTLRSGKAVSAFNRHLPSCRARRRRPDVWQNLPNGAVVVTSSTHKRDCRQQQPGPPGHETTARISGL
jgi:hypothetical protein